MSHNIFFNVVCPSCKRGSQVEMRMLGKQSTCVACSHQFKANSPDSFSAALDDPLSYWIHFTEHGILGMEPAIKQDSNSQEFEFGDSDIGRTPR